MKNSQMWQILSFMKTQHDGYIIHGESWRHSMMDISYMGNHEDTAWWIYHTWGIMNTQHDGYIIHGESWRHSMMDISYMGNHEDTAWWIYHTWGIPTDLWETGVNVYNFCTVTCITYIYKFSLFLQALGFVHGIFEHFDWFGMSWLIPSFLLVLSLNASIHHMMCSLESQFCGT